VAGKTDGLESNQSIVKPGPREVFKIFLEQSSSFFVAADDDGSILSLLS
jgi:hypothetical protein